MKTVQDGNIFVGFECSWWQNLAQFNNIRLVGEDNYVVKSLYSVAVTCSFLHYRYEKLYDIRHSNELVIIGD
jgi:hypothetical protein